MMGKGDGGGGALENGWVMVVYHQEIKEEEGGGGGGGEGEGEVGLGWEAGGGADDEEDDGVGPLFYFFLFNCFILISGVIWSFNMDLTDKSN
ncbi:hypothetical protein HanRHA438_Chr12g0572741 [Helianthus annuus]|nr:hypothetical protein HanRHA438_Chr12g0572741 [Helianthus annuus]